MGTTNKKSSVSKKTARKSASAKGTSAKTQYSAKPKKNTRKNVDIAVKNEVALIVVFAVAIFVFLCVVNIIRGAAASAIRSVMFGIFGLLAYIIPLIIFFGLAFSMSNKGNTVAVIKLVSGVVLVFLAGIASFMLMRQNDLIDSESLIKSLYATSSEQHAGGGVLFGIIAALLYKLIGFVGTLFLTIVLGIISVVFITEKSFLSGVKKGSEYLYESARADAQRRREYREKLIEEREFSREYEDINDRNERGERTGLFSGKNKKTKHSNPQPQENTADDKKMLRMDKKIRGVPSPSSISLSPTENHVGGYADMHEIKLVDGLDDVPGEAESIELKSYAGARRGLHSDELSQKDGYKNEIYGNEPDADGTHEEGDFVKEAYDGEFYNNEIHGNENYDTDVIELEEIPNEYGDTDIEPDYFDSAAPMTKSFMDELGDIESGIENEIKNMPEPLTENTVISKPGNSNTDDVYNENKHEENKQNEQIRQFSQNAADDTPERKYIFPPVSLLKKGDAKKGDSSGQLKETAYRLQQTLQNFGVKVTITNISQGPSVTRYEMQPEQGVKVSKIVGLADDIKLNLAATDIRIEAPIPGKAAVGIEVPNKENSIVSFRELIESDEFKNFKSNLCFAVGKDIAGQVVVTDIAKMPHVLIAGATGSGKSVCINTIIMSILYKADPADVKLIMIDPKVVELSVYNGIPHLMIPVVTDPKKASAALNWGVAEMTERYKLFADLNVRDIKGYNKAVQDGKMSGDGQPLKKMPHILIIVDELADLMMVASNEVEESICRLAQLARACGIHLVIATQRPSVDVITGLIKANMPSRIAFSVSSGVDSRTILDMNGAEKLLGKGDMLFYPQGYPKPARVQGAFVSDSEVSDVVDYLKNQMLGNTYSDDVEEKIRDMQSSSSSVSGGASGGNDFDSYFAEAGKFVIEKEKASIGMLQRVFKIGFNRAARIVDQLEAAGVVGAEEGTKPRRILMSMEEFENYVSEKL